MFANKLFKSYKMKDNIKLLILLHIFTLASSQISQNFTNIVKNPQEDEEKSFQKNSQIIERHNKENSDFQLGYNEFSKVDPEEFVERYCGTSLPEKFMTERPMLKRGRTVNNYTLENLPESIDFRKYSLSVKDQGSKCGKN